MNYIQMQKDTRGIFTGYTVPRGTVGKVLEWKPGGMLINFPGLPIVAEINPERTDLYRAVKVEL